MTTQEKKPRARKLDPKQLAAHRKAQLQKRILNEHARQATFAQVAEEIKSGIDRQVEEGELGVKELLSKYIHDNPGAVKLPYGVENCDDPAGFLLGGWECAGSPTGYCVYHDREPRHDQCLFCGDPEERK